MAQVQRRNKTTANFFKPRMDHKLGFLSDEQHLKLVQWMLTYRLPYYEIVQRVKDEFGIQITTKTLCNYYKQEVAAYLIERRNYNVAVALKVKDAVRRKPGEFYPATIDALQQMAFKLASDENSDPRQLHLIFDLVMRSNEQEIRRKSIELKLRRLQLLEKKAAVVEATVRDTHLSDSELAERMRGIFQLDKQTPNGTKNGDAEKRYSTDGISA